MQKTHKRNRLLGQTFTGLQPTKTENTGYWLTDIHYFQARFSKPKKIKPAYQSLLAYGHEKSVSPAGLPGPIIQWPITAGFSQSQLRASGGIPAWGRPPPSSEIYRLLLNTTPESLSTKRNAAPAIFDTPALICPARLWSRITSTA
jgi:hypothetical protein